MLSKFLTVDLFTLDINYKFVITLFGSHLLLSFKGPHPNIFKSNPSFFSSLSHVSRVLLQKSLTNLSQCAILRLPFLFSLLHLYFQNLQGEIENFEIESLDEHGTHLNEGTPDFFLFIFFPFIKKT